MNKFLFIPVTIICITSSLFSFEEGLTHINSASLYINMITKSISRQFKDNQKLNLEKENIITTPMVDIYAKNTRLAFTKKIDENLLYAMSMEGFSILDRTGLSPAQEASLQAKYLLVATFMMYKNDIVLNFRIVDKQTKQIVSVAQASIPKRIIKKIERFYKKDIWFSKVK